MANSSNLNQIAGKHLDIYEAYYKQLDPKNTNMIPALVSAKFLKKSGLSDVVLSRIWDLSDPAGRGFLDKPGLFVALKLVALAQSGENINMKNILQETQNPPKVGDIPKIKPVIPRMTPANNTIGQDWSVKPDEKLKYEQLFESLQPVEGILPGNKVKGLLMDSKLPIETLSTIWELADQDKDGSLDKHEFIIAMHLVYQALAKRVIPSVLPKELLKPKTPEPDSFNSGFVANFDMVEIPMAAPIPVPMQMTSVQPPLIEPMKASPITVQKSGWVLTPMEKLRYEEIFEKSDLDKDGLVSGLEIKDVFIKSGLTQNCLAHIWALCDTNQTGKLNCEQFCLAMWMVERKKRGIEPPHSLTPEMIPPSMRPNAEPLPPPKPLYTNPELDMISKEIEELAKERRILETDVAQKEADIRIKSGEVRSLQSELDTLTATLKQLENQKGEAQKRLDDLKAQKKEVEDNVGNVIVEIDLTRDQVTKIRDQCQKQESTLKEQESELDTKRSELQKLKEEEQSLEREYDTGLKDMDKLSRQLQDTQLQISQIKAMVSQLEEIQHQMNDALAMCRSAIEANDPQLVSEYSLKIEPEFREFHEALKVKEEPVAFNGSDSDGKINGFKATGFKEAPARFEESFNNSSGFGDQGFSSAFDQPKRYGDTSADPFGDKSGAGAPARDVGKDDFGSDPFAILHAPTTSQPGLSPAKSGAPPRPESPSPALPPKKTKQAPPRPAPPRPLQGPKPSHDAFGSQSFANFDDFETKTLTREPAAIPTVIVDQNIDFVVDPFADYRYEDVFSIKDPFTDEVEDPFAEKAAVGPKNNTQQNAFGQDNGSSGFIPLKNRANNNNNTKKTEDPFAKSDPFSVIPSSKQIKTDFHNNFKSSDTNNNNDRFEVNFEDEFSKTSDFNNFLKKDNDQFNNNFAKFDAFNGNSTLTLPKNEIDSFTKNLNQDKKVAHNAPEKLTKFNEDYSDNFEMDLQDVLQRSLQDK